jgi:uncharacterized membrane protein
MLRGFFWHCALSADVTTLGIEYPRRQVAFAATAAGFRVMLKRNCSMSPRGLLLAFALPAALTLAIASVFALLGAWLILPFAGLEAAALGAAFWFTARHAADYERIELERGRLRVEVSEAARLRRYDMDARLARLRVEGELVVLRAPRAQLELGRHLDAAARVDFAAELGERLQR